MGLQAEIQADIAEAFNTDLSDAVSEFIGKRSVSNDSPINEWLSTPTTNTEINYTGRGIFTGYRQNEIDGQTIKSTDIKLIMLQNEVTIEPMTGDIINSYQVMNTSKDPANVTWIVQLRGV